MALHACRHCQRLLLRERPAEGVRRGSQLAVALRARLLRAALRVRLHLLQACASVRVLCALRLLCALCLLRVPLALLRVLSCVTLMLRLQYALRLRRALRLCSA